jgi:hypothetical protein
MLVEFQYSTNFVFLFLTDIFGNSGFFQIADVKDGSHVLLDPILAC